MKIEKGRVCQQWKKIMVQNQNLKAKIELGYTELRETGVYQWRKGEKGTIGLIHIQQSSSQA